MVDTVFSLPPKDIFPSMRYFCKFSCSNLILVTVGDLIVASVLVLVVALGLKTLATQQAGKPLEQDFNGIVSLSAPDAQLDGKLQLYPMDLEKKTTNFEYFYGRELHAEQRSRVIRNWTGPNDLVRWDFMLKESGEFEVELVYRTRSDSFGNEFEVQVAEVSLSGLVRFDQRFPDGQRHLMGRVHIEQPGVHTLLVKVVQLSDRSFLELLRVRLLPVEVT